MLQIDYSKLNKVEKYFGTVVKVDTESFTNRCKVRVNTIFDDIDEEHIPWAYPKFLTSNEFNYPAIGDIVYVEFDDNDENFPRWFTHRDESNISNVDSNDLPSAQIIAEKDLSKFNLDGMLSVRYTKTDGIVIELKRNDKLSQIIIRNDNTILLKNGKSKQIVHLSNECISLGSENTSAQPAVNGDDNHKSLNMLNDTIKELSNKMNEQLQILAYLAASSPYTSHLQSGFNKYRNIVKQTIDNAHSKNKDFFPETLSKAVRLDKTKP